MPVHEPGRSRRSAVTYSTADPGLACLAAVMADGAMSNAVTSKPWLARNSASYPSPQPTTRARLPTLSVAASANHSTRCGFGVPSAQGTTDTPASASRYSVSNQPPSAPRFQLSDPAGLVPCGCRLRRQLAGAEPYAIVVCVHQEMLTPALTGRTGWMIIEYSAPSWAAGWHERNGPPRAGREGAAAVDLGPH